MQNNCLRTWVQYQGTPCLQNILGVLGSQRRVWGGEEGQTGGIQGVPGGIFLYFWQALERGVLNKSHPQLAAESV